MRVLHVANELRPSGMETMLRTAAAFWAARGIDGEILAIGDAPGDYAAMLGAAGYQIHHLPFRRSPAFLADIYRIFRSHGADGIHIHCERGNFWYAALARLAGHRHIVRSVHSAFAFHGALRLRRLMQRWIMRCCLGVRTIACGPSVQRVEWDRFRNPSRAILDWFDDTRFRMPTPSERQAARTAAGIGSDTLALVTVGNCSVVKNHTAVIEALALLPTDSDIQYLHAGWEEEGHPERRLAERLGVSGRIRFLGPVLDVVPLLHAADLFLMPSLYEGLGIAAVEAMGTGLPVVLGDVEGLRDLGQIAPAAYAVVPDASEIAIAIMHFCRLGANRRAEIGRELSVEIRKHCAVAVGASRYAEVYAGGPTP
jgi:glycosyltransferase involved in cell wall biosynthesis